VFLLLRVSFFISPSVASMGCRSPPRYRAGIPLLLISPFLVPSLFSPSPVWAEAIVPFSPFSQVTTLTPTFPGDARPSYRGWRFGSVFFLFSSSCGLGGTRGQEVPSVLRRPWRSDVPPCFLFLFSFVDHMPLMPP